VNPPQVAVSDKRQAGDLLGCFNFEPIQFRPIRPEKLTMPSEFQPNNHLALHIHSPTIRHLHHLEGSLEDTVDCGHSSCKEVQLDRELAS
jgi:hypothetical protein